MVAESVIIMVMAPIAGALSDRFGSRLLCTTGCALIGAAQFFLATLNLHAPVVVIILPLIVWGIGWSLFNAPNQSAILSAVTSDKMGAAAGMISTTARTGGAWAGVIDDAIRYLLANATSGSRWARRKWRAAPQVFMDSLSTRFTCLAFSPWFRS